MAAEESAGDVQAKDDRGMSMGYRQDGKIDPEKNCHEYCPLGKCCRYLDGKKGYNWYECTMYAKLDDLMMDGMTAYRGQDKERYECGEDW